VNIDLPQIQCGNLGCSAAKAFVVFETPCFGVAVLPAELAASEYSSSPES
jgi:hypothetical protein